MRDMAGLDWHGSHASSSMFADDWVFCAAQRKGQAARVSPTSEMQAYVNSGLQLATSTNRAQAGKTPRLFGSVKGVYRSCMR